MLASVGAVSVSYKTQIQRLNKSDLTYDLQAQQRSNPVLLFDFIYSPHSGQQHYN